MKTNSVLTLALLLGSLLCSVVAAQTQAAPPKANPPDAVQPVREIFVPLEDLPTVLKKQTERVMLSRRQYERLLTQAKRQKPPKPPRESVILSADYEITVREEEADVVAHFDVEVLGEGLTQTPVPLSGVKLRQAMWGDQPASLARNGAGRLVLLAEGPARGRLSLWMTAAVPTTAVRQVVAFEAPTPAARRMKLTAPGNVELQSGAGVVRRHVDSQKNVTQFDLAPPRGPISLTFSLNNRFITRRRLVIGRSVMVAEVTQGYERLHASVSLHVLHGAIPSYRLQTPQGFAVTNVASPDVARWSVAPDPKTNQNVLTVEFREAVENSVTLHISAQRIGQRKPNSLEDWRFPQFSPLEDANHSTVVGVLLEDRLAMRRLFGSRLIPLDLEVLTAAWPPGPPAATPPSTFAEQSSAPRLRPVAAYYAPRGEFQLQGEFQPSPIQLETASSFSMVLSNDQRRLHGAVTISPRGDRVLEADLAIPSPWRLLEVKGQQGEALLFERFPLLDQPAGERARIRLPKSVAPGGQYQFSFQVASAPAEWLADWSETTIEFPAVRVLGAAAGGPGGQAGDRGALLVKTQDDLTLLPTETENLIPLAQAERAAYHLPSDGEGLAFRYQRRPFRLQLRVGRQAPQLSARTYAFLNPAPDRLQANYEMVFLARQAGVRRLAFSLPATTPEEVKIQGAGKIAVRETSSQVQNNRRIWTVLLADKHRGAIPIDISFQQPLTAPVTAVESAIQLPLARAEGVGRQSGAVAVEGHAELDIRVATTARPIDEGEFTPARRRLGKRLIAVYGYVGGDAQVEIRASRRPLYALPPVIVERAEMDTFISVGGQSQTAARFQLRSKASYLEIALPPDAALWSLRLNSQAVKPQRDGDKLLVSLQTAQSPSQKTRQKNNNTVQGTRQDLQIFYQAPISSLDLVARIQATAPVLRLRGTSDGEGFEEVPLLQLTWRLVLPKGYRLVDHQGAEGVIRFQRRPGPLGRQRPRPTELLGQALWRLGGGVDPFYASVTKHIKQISDLAESPDRLPSMSPQGPADASAPAAPARSVTAPDPSTNANDDEIDPDEDPMALMGKEFGAGQPSTPPTASRDKGGMGGMGDMMGGMGGGMMEGMAGESAQSDSQTVAPAKQTTALSWTMDGVGGLPFDFDTAVAQADDERIVTFQSLGASPQIEATAANEYRLNALAWAAALLIVTFGLAISGKPARVKTKYIAAVVLASAAAGGAAPLANVALAYTEVFDLCLLAGVLLIPYYLLMGILAWLWRTAPRFRRAPQITAALMFVLLSAVGALAQERALIVPYDASAPDGPAKADRVLVPYQEYLRLKREGDKSPAVKKPPFQYALAGAQYEARLPAAGDQTNNLLVTGRLSIDLYDDAPVDIPLDLKNGVLREAKLDGRPARLRVAVETPRRSRKGKGKENPTDTNAKLLLHVAGAGRKVLEFSLRLPISRQGGWRVVNAQLPAAPAAQIHLHIEQKGTEFRLASEQPPSQKPSLPSSAGGQLSGRITQSENETMTAGLGGEGQVAFQWRPQFHQIPIDQSLTARSQALLDIREDAVRLAWRVELALRGGRRDAFSFWIPQGYVVEQVSGENVRGWQRRRDRPHDRLDITLLKTADRRETLLVRLAKLDADVWDGRRQFDAPWLAVADAALQQGTLTIRKSPLLDLSAAPAAGLTRADLPTATAIKRIFNLAASAASDQAASAASDQASGDSASAAPAGESPWELAPFQSLRFSSAPYRLRLTTSPIAAEVRAGVQTLLRFEPQGGRVESRINLEIGKRPLHKFTLLFPAAMERIELSAPVKFESSTFSEENVKRIDVYLSTGQQGNFSLVARGVMPIEENTLATSLPQIRVQDAAHLTGHLVVQADPAFRAQAENLKNCETTPLSETYHWLQPSQRKLAALALATTSADYSGMVRLTRRTPQVTGLAVSNVKVSDEAIEETVVLVLQIAEAGISELAVTLPARLADARVKAELLRQKTVQTLARDNANTDNNRVRIHLRLQDEILGRYVVVIEKDRAFSNDRQQAAIPLVEVGDAGVDFIPRYITLENVSHDELVVDQEQGVRSLVRPSAEWETLSPVMGGRVHQAYVVHAESDLAGSAARLEFHLNKRQTIATTGARIGLAETFLLVDRQGAYRGRQKYHLENHTEPYLEIELPPGARLWTVLVAGSPVKPSPPENGLRPGNSQPAGIQQDGATSASEAPSRVRIPLVKTAEGDQDYVVEFVYGGRMPPLKNFQSTRFPLVQTRNINVERSQVRLRLPKTHRWVRFGGSMRQVNDRWDLVAGELEYQTRQITKWTEQLGSSNKYVRLRAKNNIKQLGLSLHNYQSQSDNSIRSPRAGADPAANRRWMLNNDMNKDAIQRARRRLEETERDADQSKMFQFDNRAQFRQLQQEQSIERGRNTLGELGGNFGQIAPAQTARPSRRANEFQQGWLSKNNLGVAAGGPAGQAGQQQMQSGAQQGQSRQDDQSRQRTPDFRDEGGKGPALPQLQPPPQEAPKRGDRSPKGDPSPKTAQTKVESSQPLRGSSQGRSGPGALPARADGEGEQEQTKVDETVSRVTGGLASLQIDFPKERKDDYMFTTPRGDLSITGTPIENRWLLAVLRLTLAFGGALLMLVSLRRMKRQGRIGPIASILLILVGVGGLISGVFPLVGMLAVIFGGWQLFRRV